MDMDMWDCFTRDVCLSCVVFRSQLPGGNVNDNKSDLIRRGYSDQLQLIRGNICISANKSSFSSRGCAWGGGGGGGGEGNRAGRYTTMLMDSVNYANSKQDTHTVSFSPTK